MSGGGGGGGGIGSMLPLALALGATVATGGAAAPALGEAILGEGVAGAGLLGSGLIGAGTGGLGAALTGGNVGQSALMGGLGGAATAGIMGGLGGSGLGPVTEAPTDAAGMVNPGTSMPQQAPYTSESNPFKSSGTAPMPQDFAGIQNPAMSMPTEDPTKLTGSNPQTIAGQDLSKADSKGGWSSLSGMQKAGIIGAGGLGLAALSSQQNTITPQPSQGVPKGLQFHFNEDPNAMYKPSIAPYYNGVPTDYPQEPYAKQKRGYADGGTVEQMSRENAMGNNQMFPQAGLGGLTGMNSFQNATNTPMGTNVIEPTDAVTDPYTGQMKFATGGIAGYARGGDLGSYSDGGRMLKGPGDGMSDSIPARIGKHQPARLADGEFVVPADVVSHLGNGSTDAGAKHLYAMMDKVRKARTGRKAQGKQIKPEKYLRA